jgi:hypothetical protein
MIDLYSELNQYSEFILTQLVACDNGIVSIAAKRVLLIRNLSNSVLDGYSLDDLCSF